MEVFPYRQVGTYGMAQNSQPTSSPPFYEADKYIKKAMEMMNNLYISPLRRINEESDTGTTQSYTTDDQKILCLAASKRSPMQKLVMQWSMTAQTLQRQGKLLTNDQFEAVWKFLPARYQTGQCTLAFSTAEDGVSIQTFLNKLQGFPASLMIIRSTKGDLFGAFCSSEWRANGKGNFFGTGESFLFTSEPVSDVYHWIGWNSQAGPDLLDPSKNLFQSASLDSVIIGDGGESAIRFQSDLTRGRTGRCATFNNAPLCKTADFVTASIEVYGLHC